MRWATKSNRDKGKLPPDLTINGLVGIGIGIGSSAVVAIVAAYKAVSDFTAFCEFAAILKEWQTLLAGLLAVGIGYWTVLGIREQIEQTEVQAEDRRERRHFADKAALPVALSALVSYSDSCIDALKKYGKIVDPNGRLIAPDGWQAPLTPPLPIESVNVLKSCIESAPLEHREAMAWVCRKIQIINSRLTDMPDETRPDASMVFVRQNLLEYMVDLLEFRVRVSKMFSYARGARETIECSLAAHEMSSAAFHLAVEDNDFPGIEETIDRRARFPTAFVESST